MIEHTNARQQCPTWKSATVMVARSAGDTSPSEPDSLTDSLKTRMALKLIEQQTKECRDMMETDVRSRQT